MKKGILFLMLFLAASLTCLSQARAKANGELTYFTWYATGDVGYSTEHYIQGAGAGGLQYQPFEDRQDIHLIVESGFRIHATLNDAVDYWHLSTGIHYNVLTLTAGILYGGNQPKQDVHYFPDTHEYIILKQGAPTANYTSYQFAARFDVFSLDNLTCSLNGIYIPESQTLAYPVYYGGIGIKLTYQ